MFWSLTQVSKCELNVLGELLHFADMQQCSDVPANSCEECVKNVSKNVPKLLRKNCNICARQHYIARL